MGQARDFLWAHGFAVVRAALDARECAEVVDLLWDWLEALGTGIRRGDPDTWGDDRWPPTIQSGPGLSTGIIPYFGIGQSRAMWRVRANASVRRAFARIYGVEEGDLISSFDGASLFRPGCQGPGGWFHVDQHPVRRPGFECVQGLVNLLPMSPATGGNVLVPGSHADFEGLARRYPDELAEVREDEDFFGVPEGDPLFGRAAVMAHLAVGDLLIWDSRTLHCNRSGLPEPTLLCEDPALGSRATPRQLPAASCRLLRAAAFVCMVPWSRASRSVLGQRRLAVQEGLTTAHRPHVFQSTLDYDHWRRVQRDGLLPKGIHTPRAQLRRLADMSPVELSLVGGKA